MFKNFGRSFLMFGAFNLLLTVAFYVYAGTLPLEHHTSVTIELAQPVATVRGRVLDWRSTSDWKASVTRVEDAGVVDGRQRFRECAFDCLTFEIVATEPDYVTQIVDDPDLGGTWTWRFAETAAGGTSLTVTEDGVVHNRMVRFFMHHAISVDGQVKAGLSELRASFD